jgi:hypothetical protein
MVKAGDWLELIEGKRSIKDVRELCGKCAMLYQWSEDGSLIKNKTLEEMKARGV